MAVRWGICSAGKISHDFVVGLKSGENSKQHAVTAVAARSSESAAKFAETHSIPKFYGSYEQLAEDPDVSEPEYELAVLAHGAAGGPWGSRQQAAPVWFRATAQLGTG